MPELDPALVAQLKRLGGELDRRHNVHRAVRPYDEGGCPIPEAVVLTRRTRAYRALIDVSDGPWGSLVVDSVQDRLEATGIRSGDQDVDDRIWGLWQDNYLDSESKLAHRSSLLDGRSFALIWPNLETGQPEISFDEASQMVVQYQEGSRRHRVAAMRRWLDNDKVPHATLYTPTQILKFQGNKDAGLNVDTRWEARGDDWQVENPYGVVPVVELAVNRRLKPGSFGYARGEYAHCTGLIDRINLLTFLGLVVAFWMGFPLRGVIGDEIMRDDDGNVMPPFDVAGDSVFQLENPNAKLAEYSAADRKNLSVFAELDQLAVITKTPRHYFPLEQGMSNLSADAIRASEGALHAKVTGHKASLGEGWEEVLRVAGRMLPEPVQLSPRAELTWADHESRSLAERADAASKLKDVLPWQATAELALNATGEQLSRWESQRTSDGFGQLLAAATSTPTNLLMAGAEPAG